ncbi:hypothetical protein AK88_02089 [Plasmodium fragile]|uniref:Uncharacterized protein n=1 Tax=Plasmodium fragile TaxID=5857 RepID=A0A0D9QN04_PLAFR|nr:uncharacterized protein AK88_02089 [Plasmodium fragile]KJP88308.1 hypothetical protein AK88_02089 [Plasmodium fragile]
MTSTYCKLLNSLDKVSLIINDYCFPSSIFDKDFTSYINLYSLLDVSLDTQDQTYFSKRYINLTEIFSHYYKKKKAKEGNSSISQKCYGNFNYHINYFIFHIYIKRFYYINIKKFKNYLKLLLKK